MVVVPFNNEQNITRISNAAPVNLPNSQALPEKPIKKERKTNKQKSLDKISFIVNLVLKS